MNQQHVHKTLNTEAGLAAFFLRIPVGIILAAHGAQKLFGWFGGYGLEGTGQWMASIGLEPGYLMALMAGSAEFFGGIALVVGLLARPAALVSAVTMVVAIVTVHLDNGLFMSNNGYEFALTLLAATVALTIQGAGSYSVDNVIAENFLKGNSEPSTQAATTPA
ncbi:MAG: DoxX family protein [Gammaproteobacteria bacterium]|jgi:putative oxidoreductase